MKINLHPRKNYDKAYDEKIEANHERGREIEEKKKEVDKGIKETSEVKKQLQKSGVLPPSQAQSEVSEKASPDRASTVSRRLDHTGASLHHATIMKASMKERENLAKPYKGTDLTPAEFVFGFDGDDQGVLYHLGSMGKTQPWFNPGWRKQVTAWASSIGKGKPEDVLGRHPSEFITKSEPYSWIVIDVGKARKLSLRAYTLRNRHSISNVCLSW